MLMGTRAGKGHVYKVQGFITVTSYLTPTPILSTPDIYLFIMSTKSRKINNISIKDCNTNATFLHTHTTSVTQWLMTPPVTRQGMGPNSAQVAKDFYTNTEEKQSRLSKEMGAWCVRTLYLTHRSVSMSSEHFQGG